MSAFSRRNVGSQWNLGSERRDRQSRTTNWNRNDWKTEASYGLSLIFDEALSHNICRRTIIKPLQMSETSSATVSYAIPPHITRQIYALQIWKIYRSLKLNDISFSVRLSVSLWNLPHRVYPIQVRCYHHDDNLCTMQPSWWRWPECRRHKGWSQIPFQVRGPD